LPIGLTLKLAASLLVACAFLLAHIADAQLCDDKFAIACVIGQEANSAEQRDEGRGEHEDRGKNCGPCHAFKTRQVSYEAGLAPSGAPSA